MLGRDRRDGDDIHHRERHLMERHKINLKFFANWQESFIYLNSVCGFTRSHHILQNICHKGLLYLFEGISCYMHCRGSVVL